MFIKHCSYEGTQNSALFHRKLIKSILHLYETFFKLTERPRITNDGPPPTKLHHFWLFFPSSPINHASLQYSFLKLNAMVYWTFVHALLKILAHFVLAQVTYHQPTSCHVEPLQIFKIRKGKNAEERLFFNRLALPKFRKS